MAKRKGASATSCSRARKKVDRDAREVENAQRLDSLPLEVWDKIFDEIDENDLFPLALSCSLQVLSSEAEGAGGADETE